MSATQSSYGYHFREKSRSYPQSHSEAETAPEGKAKDSSEYRRKLKVGIWTCDGLVPFGPTKALFDSAAENLKVKLNWETEEKYSRFNMSEMVAGHELYDLGILLVHAREPRLSVNEDSEASPTGFGVVYRWIQRCSNKTVLVIAGDGCKTASAEVKTCSEDVYYKVYMQMGANLMLGEKGWLFSWDEGPTAAHSLAVSTILDSTLSTPRPLLNILRSLLPRPAIRVAILVSVCVGASVLLHWTQRRRMRRILELSSISPAALRPAIQERAPEPAKLPSYWDSFLSLWNFGHLTSRKYKVTQLGGHAMVLKSFLE